MPNFPIFGGYSKSDDIGFNSEDLCNMFMLAQPQGKKKLAFLGCPGLSMPLTVQAGGGAARTLEIYENPLQDFMFGVFGGDVYRFTDPLVASRVGSMGTTKGFVRACANNGNQMAFVDGSKGYVYNTQTSTYNQITSSGFAGQPLDIAFMDGFGIVPYGDENAFGISAPNDFLNWEAGDKAPLQVAAGKNVGVGVINERIFFFSSFNTQIWYNAGAPDFPFRPDRNSIFEFGCKAASSIKSDFGYLFWLANDKNGVGSVMMTTGSAPKRISNEAVETLISRLTAPEDVSCYIYKDVDHIIYSMNWTTDDVTLEYDVTLDYWFRKEMLPTLADPLIPYSGKRRFVGNCHAYFKGKHYVGSYKRAELFEMSRDYRTYAGEQIRRVRVAPHFFDESYRMLQIKSLQIDMRTGVGLSHTNDGVGVDPKLFLRISRDHRPFGNYHARSIGRIGNTAQRVIFRDLGICRDFVPEISFSDPVLPVSILGASIEYEVLSK